jgi:hypothetical protein
MNAYIKSGFEDKLKLISLNDIISTKTNLHKIKQSNKYKQILASIKEVGIVEPPVVIWNENKKKFIILDGNLRITALKEIGYESVMCIISTDDEGYTYNRYVNRLSAIQSNKMILNAINNGVSEKKIAKALNISIRSLRTKKTLINGICQEAVDILKDKIISENVFLILKKMKPIRQIDAALMMNDQQLYGLKFAEKLLGATSDDMLISPRKISKLSPTEIDKRIRLEQESLALSSDLRSIHDRYGIDMITFSSIQAYLKRLLNNEKVADFIQQYYPDIFEKFTQICAINFTRMENA